MAGDPTQVDWNYQLANIPSSFPPGGPAGGDLSGSYPDPTVAGLQGRPVDPSTPSVGDVLTWSGSVWSPAPGGGGSFSLSQINPSLGPFTGTGLVVDHSRGLLASAGPALSMELSAYAQAGVIGGGSQQLKGPICIARGTAPSAASYFAGSALLLQNGYLGFIDDRESPSGGPHAFISYGYSSAGALQLTSENAVLIQSSNNYATPLNLYNLNSGDQLYLGANGVESFLDSFTSFRMGVGGGAFFLRVQQNPTPGVYPAFTVDLQGSTGLPLKFGAFSINGNAGAQGTLLDGSTVYGGLVMTIGSTRPGGPPTGGAGGDLTGSYPSPTIGKLQGVPLVATGGSSGDVLTYSGGSWVPAAVGTPTSISQTGGSFSVNALGYCFINPSAGNPISFFGAAGRNQGNPIGTTAGFTANASGNTVDSHSTFDGGLGGSAYTIGDLFRIMIQFGLLAP